MGMLQEGNDGGEVGGHGDFAPSPLSQHGLVSCFGP